MTRPTCPVTVWDSHLHYHALGRSMRRCGLPVVGRLCVRHEAERVRLGGGVR